MIRGAATVVLLSLVLAGCFAPGDHGVSGTTGAPTDNVPVDDPSLQPWTALPCDASGATQRNMLARTPERYALAPQVWAERLALAAGLDYVIGSPAVEGSTYDWDLQGDPAVRITLHHPDPHFIPADGAPATSIRYVGPPVAEDIEAFVALLDGWGLEASSLTPHMLGGAPGKHWRLDQLVGEHVNRGVFFAAWGDNRMEVSGHVPFDVPIGTTVLSNSTATEFGLAYARCDGDQVQFQADRNVSASIWVRPVMAWNGTMALTVTVHDEDTPCGEPDSYWIQMDAVTGAILTADYEANCNDSVYWL